MYNCGHNYTKILSLHLAIILLVDIIWMNSITGNPLPGQMFFPLCSGIPLVGTRAPFAEPPCIYDGTLILVLRPLPYYEAPLLAWCQLQSPACQQSEFPEHTGQDAVFLRGIIIISLQFPEVLLSILWRSKHFLCASPVFHVFFELPSLRTTHLH